MSLHRSATMELLAPVGSFAAFEAALVEGANSVYIGAPALNARVLGRDFSYAEIRGMVEHAHRKGVKVYIAMNSLVKEDELALAIEGLASCAEIGVDALIIQDLGLFFLARSYFPEVPLHASTLMTIHNSAGVAKLVELGFSRIVLPRELTLEEIGAIYRETGAELEVFVHGAMCFSYSGLCLFSSLHGGKSSLRGQCVQPCRRRYVWQKKTGQAVVDSFLGKDGGYLFSMNDLCGIELLPQLRQAGVSCLKIEGRMKSAQYVRYTVRAYRLLLDSMASGNMHNQLLMEEVRQLLDDAMGRRRSTGFFLDPKPREAVTPHISGNIGLIIGRVQRLENIRGRGQQNRTLLGVTLQNDVKTGDRLRLHDDRSGERASFTLRTMKLGNRVLDQARSGQQVTLVVDQAFPFLRKGAFSGSLFKVDISSRRKEEDVARSRFASGPGKTFLVTDQVRIERIRRSVPGLDGGYRVDERLKGRTRGAQWWLKVGTWREMYYRLPVKPARYLLAITPENLDAWRHAGGRPRRDRVIPVWCLPAVILDGEMDWYSKAIEVLMRDGCRDFQLGHHTQQALFARIGSEDFRLFADYTCNLLNSMSVQCLEGMGFAGAQLSLESDRENMMRLLSHRQCLKEEERKRFPLGLCVFGRPPLFTARLADPRYQYGRRFVSPKGEAYILERGEGVTHIRSVMPFSLLQWRKELEHGGVDYFVADVSAGNIKKNIADFTVLYHQRGTLPPVLAGNYQGGLR